MIRVWFCYFKKTIDHESFEVIRRYICNLEDSYDCVVLIDSPGLYNGKRIRFIKPLDGADTKSGSFKIVIVLPELTPTKKLTI